MENNKYELITKESVLINLETMELTDDEYNIVKNGAIIPKKFNNDICAFKYKKLIVAIYKTYHKDETMAKPFKMF